MQIICTSLQTDNHASTSSLSLFTGQMLFLTSIQQCQSPEGNNSLTEWTVRYFSLISCKEAVGILAVVVDAVVCVLRVDHVTHRTSNPVLQTALIASRSLTTDQRDDIFTQLTDNARLFHVTDEQT